MRPAEDHNLFFLGATKREIEECRLFFSQGMCIFRVVLYVDVVQPITPHAGARTPSSPVSLQGAAQLVITLLQELSEELVGLRHYDKFIKLIERLHARTRGPATSPSAVSPRRMTAYVAKVLWEELSEPNKGSIC